MILFNDSPNPAAIRLQPSAGSTPAARNFNFTLAPYETVIKQLTIGYSYALLVTIDGTKSPVHRVDNLSGEIVIRFIPARVTTEDRSAPSKAQ